MATSNDDPPFSELAQPTKVEMIDARITMGTPDTRPPSSRKPVPLWIAIRNRRTGYTDYAKFVNQAFCAGRVHPAVPDTAGYERAMADLRPGDAKSDCLRTGWFGHGMNAYDLLKSATEIFLLLECGVFISKYVDNGVATIPGAEPERVSGDVDLASLQSDLANYLGAHRLPYINRIVESTLGPNAKATDLPFCGDLLRGRVECPCFLELVWSYWQEEGMLVQGLNALSMRFQNRRIADGRDPLAQLELSPLRPLSSIFWGYVQDEQHRLSLSRRNAEYEHEYAMPLRGKAVQSGRIADRRSKFIESFHDLLYRCSVYYRDSANLQFNPDPFPLLNGLKDTHLILSQGAGNQFADLTWTARVEMLMQQWILARPEIREFLGRRPMVAYEEDWMANADALKSLMGWSDTSVVHFRNLATFGEQLLLSIRWHLWASENDAQTARDWANLFRPEIQGYIYAYRVATGVDLTVEAKDAQATTERNQSPSLLLERRLADQRRAAAAP
jgi:hypothetical protein